MLAMLTVLVKAGIMTQSWNLQLRTPAITFYFIGLLALAFCCGRRRNRPKNKGQDQDGSVFWNPTRDLWEGTAISASTTTRSSENFTLEEIIRSAELFHNIDDEYFNKQLANVKTLSLTKGETIPSVNELALIVVLKGNMKLLIHDNHIGEELDNREETVNFEVEFRTGKRRVLKTIQQRESLTFKLSILSSCIEVIKNSESNAYDPPITTTPYKETASSSQDDLIKLQAGAESIVAVLSLEDLLSSYGSNPSNTLPLAQTVLRVFYNITFHSCRDNFGMHNEVLKCQRALYDLVKDERHDEITESTTLDILRSIPRDLDTSGCLQTSSGVVLRADSNRQFQLSPPLVSGVAGVHSSSQTLVEMAARQSIAAATTLDGGDTDTNNNHSQSQHFISGHDDLRFRKSKLVINIPECESRPTSNNTINSASLLSQTESSISIQSGISSFKTEEWKFKLLHADVASKIFRVLWLPLDDSTNEIYRNRKATTPFLIASDYSPLHKKRRKLRLDITSPSMMDLGEFEKNIQIVYFPKGTILAREGQRYPGLYYVLDGDLRAKSAAVESYFGDEEENNDGQALCTEFRIGKGGIIGYGGILEDNKSLYTIQAQTETYIGFLSRRHLLQIVDQNPLIFSLFAKRFLQVLPEIIRLVDFSLDRIKLEPGQKVYDTGDVSNGFYTVLNGRLRTYEATNATTRTNNDSFIREFGRGQSVGALELYTQRKRPAPLVAIRQSEVVRIQLSAYKSLSITYPPLAISLAKLISGSAPRLIEDSAIMKNSGLGRGPISSQWTVRTIAVLPLSPDIVTEKFARILHDSIIGTGIESAGDVLTLESGTILKSLRGFAFNKEGHGRLEEYLTVLEGRVNVTLFVGDPSPDSEWTRICVERADVILFVGSADGTPSLTAMERNAMRWSQLAQKALALVHDKGDVQSSVRTSHWLADRNWITTGIHHIQLMTRDYDEDKRSNSPSPYSSRISGFDRLARRLFHRSIALVLGGGGARGLAHLGVLKVLEEEEIPIDIVGGTSMGALVGAVFSCNLDYQKTFEEIQKYARSINKIKFYMDMTIPYISVTSGKVFNKSIRDVLGDELEIGDLWLDYYCNVTNLSRNGGVAQIIRRGQLWGPVRASMSVAGLVPPYCMGGDMLIDGCYTSNVPVSPAKALGAETVFAIDVSLVSQFGPQTYGESLSGVGPFLQQLNPFNRAGSRRKIPTYAQLNDRLTFATSLAEVESLKIMPGCNYLALAIPYSATDFAKFEDIYQIGYKAARNWMTEMKATGQLSKLAIRKRAA